MFHRILKIPETHSFFLFGARGTGKTTLLHTRLDPSNTYFIDLLDLEQEARLIRDPEFLARIAEQLDRRYQRIVIDEIQRAPRLLDVVHRKSEQLKRLGRPLQFIMTGSSARKLKRGAANLLAGRAFVYNLFPLTVTELQARFSLNDALKFGTLPEIFNFENESDKAKFLKAYAETYLKEEIITEQIVRNLPPFRRFLDIAAQMNTGVINYSNIAKDINSDPKTVSGYYEILEDTLLGIRLPAYHTSIRKQQKKASKFYLFDTGIARTLAGQVDYDLIPKSFEYGQLFEAFVVNEIHRRLTYHDKQFRLSYLRVNEDLEIDLIL